MILIYLTSIIFRLIGNYAGKNLYAKMLFRQNYLKAPPEELYINWAAAMQIQFHVDELNQTFKNSREQWARNYLKHFTTQARKRSEMMIEKFVKPFEKYIAETT